MAKSKTKNDKKGETNGRAILNPPARGSSKTLMLAQLGILAAIMLILHFTGLGYFKFGIFEMTIMLVPVIIGAITLGPIGGAVLGVLFGISVCLVPGTQGVMALNAPAVIILCVGVRGLGIGSLIGVIFKGVKRFDRDKVWSYEATGLIAAMLNTFITLAGLVVIFGGAPENVGFPEGISRWAFFTGFFSMVIVQAVFEALICTIVAGLVSKAVTTYLNKSN